MDREQTFSLLSRLTKNNFQHSTEILSIASDLASTASALDPKAARRLIELGNRLSQIGEDMSNEAREAQSYISEALG